MIVIALLGMPGSGKSTLAEHMSTMTVPVYRLGAAIISEVQTRGLPITPEHEASVGMELREALGPVFLATAAIEWISNQKDSETVGLDGVYSLDELDRLTVEYGECLRTVSVLADRRLRYARLAVRTHRPLSAIEAAERDRHELAHLRKGDAIVMSDHFVVNNGELADTLKNFAGVLNGLLTSVAPA